MYSIDHLLELWDQIHQRVPGSILWLIGHPSDRVRRLCRTRDAVRLIGAVPKQDVLAYVANFDVALYPRTEDQGVQAAKVAEYLGAGVPTVSYDYRVTEILGRSGAGLVAKTPAGFVDAVETLWRDDALRSQLRAAASSAGKRLDWDKLAQQYEDQVLDRYLV